MVGSGYMARKHCLALRNSPLAQFHTLVVSSPNHQKGMEFQNEFRFRKVTGNYTEPLQDKEIDIVFICTPNQLHAQQTIESLRYGKDVFCEKPLAYTIDEFQEIEKTIKNTRQILQVGMNCRFREQYSIPYDYAKDNLLGALQYIRGTYIVNVMQSVQNREKPWVLNYPTGVLPWLHGGAIHTIDLLQWIGGDIKRVFTLATGTELGQEFIYDTFNIQFEYSLGAIGEMVTSSAAKRPDNFSLEIWGKNGSIIDQFLYLQKEERLETTEIKVTQEKIDLLLQFENMIQAIERDKQPRNSFNEAKKNFALIKAIEKSVATNKAVDVTYL